MTVVDKRQQIIDRLVALLSGLNVTLSAGNAALQQPTVLTAGNIVHNRNELPAEKVPGIIVLDADEVVDPTTLSKPGGRQGRTPPQIMKMTPEIYVVLDVRKPSNENVGEDLNLARLAILAAVLPDVELQAIIGSNGNIYYDGCVTDLARNRTMEGQLGISITFCYPL